MNSESSYIASWLTGLMQICPELSTSFRVSLNLRVFQKLLTLLLCGGDYANSGTGFALAYDFRNQNYTDCTLCEKDSFARPPRQGHYSV